MGYCESFKHLARDSAERQWQHIDMVSRAGLISCPAMPGENGTIMTIEKTLKLMEDAIYRDSTSLFFKGQDNKTISHCGENLDIPTYARKTKETYHHKACGVIKENK